jgi:hypothetical protein
MSDIQLAKLLHGSVKVQEEVWIISVVLLHPIIGDARIQDSTILVHVTTANASEN